jgi:hypothetical protein
MGKQGREKLIKLAGKINAIKKEIQTLMQAEGEDYLVIKATKLLTEAVDLIVTTIYGEATHPVH